MPVSQFAERRFYRPVWLIGAGWAAAGLWAVSGVMNLVWFGDTSPVNLMLPVLWGALALLYSRPIVVLREDGLDLAAALLRTRSVLWAEVASCSEVKPGVFELTLAAGGKVLVPVNSVRKVDRAALASELQQGIARADTATREPAAAV
jgi:hypothetical protein